MNRVILDPTTAGGRHELEERKLRRDEKKRRLEPGPSESRVSLRDDRDSEITSDFYKIEALRLLVRALRLGAHARFGGWGLPAPPDRTVRPRDRWLYGSAGRARTRHSQAEATQILEERKGAKRKFEDL